MASLDMTLDDSIKSNRTVGNRGRGRGRGRGGGRGQGRSFGNGRSMGPPRRGPLAVNARSSAYSIAKPFRRPKSHPWQRDLLEDSLKASGLPGLDSGAKLSISNLHSGVSNEDIRELFSEIGELKRYAIHYDKHGRPSGSAEVLFARRSDAFQALKRYNNVQLDGRPMRIEIEGSKSENPISARLNVVGGQRTVVMRSGVAGGRGAAASANRGFGPKNNRGGIRNGSGRGMPNARGNVRGRGSFGPGRGQIGGRGRGRGRKSVVDKSADELDKELEDYHAMQS